MKVWCAKCLEHHIDKDFIDNFPQCGFVDRRGFYMLTDDEKLRLWQLWMNPLYDELAVKYRLMVQGGGTARPADVIMEEGIPVYYPKGYSSKWRRFVGITIMLSIGKGFTNLARRIMGVE